MLFSEDQTEYVDRRMDKVVVEKPKSLLKVRRSCAFMYNGEQLRAIGKDDGQVTIFASDQPSKFGEQELKTIVQVHSTRQQSKQQQEQPSAITALKFSAGVLTWGTANGYVGLCRLHNDIRKS